MTDATAGSFDVGPEQASQGDWSALYADFLERAKALTEGDVAGADALVGDSVASLLPEEKFESLADAIAQATGHDGKGILKTLRQGRDRHEGDQILEPLLALPPTREVLPPVMSPYVAEVLLNRMFGHAKLFGREASYFQRDHDGCVIPTTIAHIGETLAPYRVRTTGEIGERKFVPAAKWWRNSRKRHQVDLVVYDPEGRYQNTGVKIENLWRGFAIEPAKGSWRRMAWHLFHVVCGSNRVHFRYLIRWLAHAVQHPGTSPGVMVVLRSDSEGVGKTTVTTWMCSIFGQHALKSGDAASVFGEFNDSLLDKSYVPLEEGGFPGDHAWAARIKNLVTNPRISINTKNRPRFEIDNAMHIMLTTNEQWAVPAGNEARRFLVLEVDHPEQDPAKRKAYFDRLYAEKDSGGLQAMLYDLLRTDLSAFNPRDVPRTAALRRQQEKGLDDVLQWTRDCVANGAFVGTGAPLQGQHENHALHDSYVQWSKNHGIRRPSHIVPFCRRLTALGFTRVKTATQVMWDVPSPGALLAATERVGGLQ